MPSHEPSVPAMCEEQVPGGSQGGFPPSMRELLASCSAANAVSTPPDESGPQPHPQIRRSEAPAERESGAPNDLVHDRQRARDASYGASLR